MFEAFDEQELFGSHENPAPVASIKHSFKGVFRNISRVLDCVTCQTCKLHGKLQLLGMGAALKILLLPENKIGDALTREEIVALVNTVGKFSHAITGARKLFKLDLENWWKDPEPKIAITTPIIEVPEKKGHASTPVSFKVPPPLKPLQRTELADIAVVCIVLSNIKVIRDTNIL